MGYSHYWSRVETPDGLLPAEPPDAYGRLAFDTVVIIDAAEHAGIALADGTGAPGTAPTVNEGGICFNGEQPDHADTLVWPATPGDPLTDVPGRRWSHGCTTNRRPYDVVVCAVLIRVAVHYGWSVRVTSDGDWDGDVIDGRYWPEWVPARHLVADLFDTDTHRSPFRP